MDAETLSIYSVVQTNNKLVSGTVVTPGHRHAQVEFSRRLFLRQESSSCPYHVASVGIFTQPDDAPRNYMKTLVANYGRIPEVWPIFKLKLDKPDSTRNLHWVEAEDYDPNAHLIYHRLPRGSQFEDLLDLLSQAHEVVLDRHLPLWQVHIVDGLPNKGFAVYSKIHHALVDGISGFKIIQEILSNDPNKPLLSTTERPHRHKKPQTEESLADNIKGALNGLARQSKALAETSVLFGTYGLDYLLGRKDVPKLPFTAPRTILNKKLGPKRRIIPCQLPIVELKQIGHQYGGTLNDVVTAICGSALRRYLSEQDQLPKKTLTAGMPVFIKSAESEGGNNSLSFMICPFATDLEDPVERLKVIVKATTKGKKELSALISEAHQDLAVLSLVPFLVLNLTHTTHLAPPAFNAVVSNFPGPKEQLYLEGSRLEALYPISIVADGMGLNITLISYQDKLCISIVAAQENEPNIQNFGGMIEDAFQELLATLKIPPTKS